MWRRQILALCLGCLSLGVLAGGPAILLAETLRDDIDVRRYLVSEKLDGVRAIWDGRTLRFRSGQVISAPAWFLAGLPAQPLDGELWLGRGQFDRLSGIVRREVADDDEWRRVRYMIFELPEAAGSFRDRAAEIRRIVRLANVDWLAEIVQFEVVDRAMLKQRFDRAVQGGAEGLMLHLADAPYVTGRSDVLLKMKPWHDAEAVVLAHQPGKGKYAGQLGALRVQMPNGAIFSLGSGFSDAQRRHPPAIGSRVTYRYQESTARGLPRFPVFLRVRLD